MSGDLSCGILAATYQRKVDSIQSAKESVRPWIPGTALLAPSQGIPCSIPSVILSTHHLCEPSIPQPLIPYGVRLGHRLVGVHPQMVVEGSAEGGGDSVGVPQLPYKR